MQSSGASRRENANVVPFVGWVERSETHHRVNRYRLTIGIGVVLMGIASLHPSYGLFES